jgi:hypothetical protein
LLVDILLEKKIHILKKYLCNEPIINNATFGGKNKKKGKTGRRWYYNWNSISLKILVFKYDKPRSQIRV